MIFLQLFYVFSKIGIFNFGGGYAMLSLIYGEVVTHYHWLTSAEFTDIVAISQSTPGPIGINAATYCGYTAVINAGYPVWAACLASVMASLSIMWLPFILMIAISRYLLKHRDAPFIQDIFTPLRPAIIGLIAAAALLLMNKDNFGSPTDNLPMFILSIVIFLAAFAAVRFKKVNPILVMLVCGIIGLIVY
ncbi:MAG: chromate transporter [Prevotellaceae bacterium]|nr:chromate transporter [Prevotellaceae bacterium]